MKVAEKCFGKDSANMVHLALDFVEIFTAPHLRNIQLIMTRFDTVTDEHFVEQVLQNFDMTYIRSGIWYSTDRQQYVWSCTTSYLYARESNTTFCQKRNLLTVQRTLKAYDNGMNVLNVGTARMNDKPVASALHSVLE
jgi:hypothetical protein